MNIYQSDLASSRVKNKVEEDVRIAYLFVVHGRSYRQILRHFKRLFTSSDFFFFHVDSRSKYLHREMRQLEKMSPQGNIRVTENRFATIWGGASLLKMMISCLREMKDMGWSMDFVINLSESDYFIKSPTDFREFLSQNRGKNFVKSHGRDIATFVKKQGLDRTFYECDNHMFRIGPRSLPQGLKLDGGSDWVCLYKSFVDYILETDQDALLRGLLNIFNYTLLPAESFFHTALKNSQFCLTYVNNNLRITNWRRQIGK